MALFLFTAAVPRVAAADRRPYDVSGFLGLRTFAANSKLGAQNLNNVKIVNSLIFGPRLHFQLTPTLLAEGEFPILISKTTEQIETLLVLFIHPRVQLTFDPLPDNKWQPFALAGAGIASSDFVDEGELVPQGHLGVGVRLPERTGFTGRLDLRWIIGPARDSGIANEFEILLSVYRPEPQPRRQTVEEEEEDEKVDSDGDGLLDEDDECPDEPEDKDGYKDGDGCPDPDNDGDSILDSDDECPREPETDNGYQDDDGCPDEVPERMRGFTGTIPGITFETDSDTLMPSSYPVLDKAVEVLKEFDKLTVTIIGHTDNVGTHEYNLDLSQRRAETVRLYLVSRGIAEDRIKAVGMGKSQPVDRNDTAEGRAKNRRVEFKVK